MKIRNILLCAAGILAFAACDKKTPSDREDNKPSTTALPAPEVTIEQGTASISAKWEPVEGAMEYRCELTYISGGSNVNVYKENVEETSFFADALRPKTKYTVRVAAVMPNGKASKNWFMEEVTTEESKAKFEIKPYEIFNRNTGHIDYVAKVTPSDETLWYWIGAVSYADRIDADLWMEQEISDALKAGETWETLVDKGYIVKGEAESVFQFTGSNHFMFTAGVLERLGDKINLVSKISLSYPFYGENFEDRVSHPCTYDDYLGEWVLMPYDRTDFSAQKGWELKEPKAFNVSISAKKQGKSFNLNGWGGSENKFLKPIVLDFEKADQNRYEHFSISVPQTIEFENDVNWHYTAWLTLVDSENKARDFAPYDRGYEQLSKQGGGEGWNKAFRGFIANGNKSVIKIFGNSFKYEGLAVYMRGLWICGFDTVGEYNPKDAKYYYNGTRGGIPNELYYLVRKDVAEGKELPAPDLTEKLTKSTTIASSETAAAQKLYKRTTRR